MLIDCKLISNRELIIGFLKQLEWYILSH